MRKEVLVISLIIILFSGCKVANYIPSQQLSQKLPNLVPEMDWLSIQTVYKDGTTYTSGSSGTAYGYYGNTPGSATYMNARSTFIKNPMIKRMVDLLEGRTRNNICENSDYNYGKIVWSVERDANGKKMNGLKFFGIISLGTFYLFGYPSHKEAGVFKVKATIHNANNAVIQTYTGSGYYEYWVACYWGYSKSDARNMAQINAEQEAINSVIKQIANDASSIRKRLMDVGPYK